MEFSYYSGALCACWVLTCSSIVHATDQLSLVALYATPVGVDENRVGACEANLAALVSSLRETALLVVSE